MTLSKLEINILLHCRSSNICVYENSKYTTSVYIDWKELDKKILIKNLQSLLDNQFLSVLDQGTYSGYKLTDKGRAAARSDEQSLTLEHAREMHDADLKNKWGDHAVAKQVLTARGRAAQQIRLVLARVYGKDGMATFSTWSIVPCLTDKGTIGILNIANGTAWETGIEADPGVFELGLVGDVYAAANGISGDCYIDNKLVQRNGTAVIDGKIVTPRMPIGWRQIGLPTWRGYEPEANHYTNVPEQLFRPEYWIRPVLVAAELMTCYGRVGDLDEGSFLTRTYGWDSKFPWGVPEWIEGKSVTLLDTIADNSNGTIQRTGVARGTDEEELQFLEAMYKILIEILAPRYRNKYESLKGKKFKYHSVRMIRKGLKECAEALECGRLPEKSVDTALTALCNETNGYEMCGLSNMYKLRACRKALDEQLPYSAAVEIARVGNLL
jgi:hypothetical protein